MCVKLKPVSKENEDAVGGVVFEVMRIYFYLNQYLFNNLHLSIKDKLTPQLQAPSAQPQVAQLQEADPQPGMLIEVWIEGSKS